MAFEERYVEWLERMDVPIEDTVTIEAFQAWLEDQLTITPERVTALWSAIELEYELLAPIGIRAVRIEYPWGVTIRFGVKGRPGLWGWTSVQRFMAEAEE